MKIYLLPVSFTVALMSPIMATASPANSTPASSRHAGVSQLSAHTQSLRQLVSAPLDGTALGLIDELSYQLESDLLLLGTPSAPIAAPLEQLHQAVEHQDSNAVLLCAAAYLNAAQRWLGHANA